MTDLHTQDHERLESYLRVHLKNGQLSQPKEEQITLLQKKKRKQLWFLFINIIAILFFGYSFFYEITRLSNTIFYILFGVFVINVFLILYQRKQLGQLIEYLEKESHSA